MGRVKQPPPADQPPPPPPSEEDEEDDVILQLAPHILAPLPGLWASAGDGGGGGAGGDGGDDGGGGEGGEDGDLMLDLRNGVMGVLVALLPRVGPRVAQVRV